MTIRAELAAMPPDTPKPGQHRLGEGPYGFLHFNRDINRILAWLTPDDPRLPDSDPLPAEEA